MTISFICSLFIECADGAGVLEWNTANDSYVALHDIVGVVTGAPADDIIFVGNNGESSATMLKPGGKTALQAKIREGQGVLKVPPLCSGFWQQRRPSSELQVSCIIQFCMLDPLLPSPTQNQYLKPACKKIFMAVSSLLMWKHYLSA